MRKLALACVLAASMAGARARLAMADEAPAPSPSPSPSASPAPGPAAPVDPKVREEARKLFEDANVDYAKGDYKASIEKLLKVSQLDPSLAGGWRNLGLSYKADGQCKEAIAAFTEYLRLQPDSRYSPRVRKEIEDCRGKLGSAAGVVLEGDIGAIAVRVGNAEGATVSIDGIMRGAAGGEPFKITPGSHELKIERPGYLPKTLSVEVLKGVTSDVSITLDEDPDAPIELRLGPGSKPVNELPDTAGLRLTLADPTLTVEVLIDDKPVGPGPEGYYTLQPGIVTVEVRAAGKDSWRRRVVLVKGQKREVAVALSIAAIVFPPFVVGFWWWHGPHHVWRWSAPPDLAAFALAQVVMVALPEEAFFRGFVQTRLHDAWPPKRTFLGALVEPRALVLQAALFALVHLAAEPRLDKLATFFPGLLFGWLRARRDGIGAAVALHALSNVLADFLVRGWLL